VTQPSPSRGECASILVASAKYLYEYGARSHNRTISKGRKKCVKP
jgi:hypothetical protein